MNGDRTTMNVSQLAQGAYHWSLSTEAGTVGRGTVTIY